MDISEDAATNGNVLKSIIVLLRVWIIYLTVAQKQVNTSSVRDGWTSLFTPKGHVEGKTLQAGLGAALGEGENYPSR
jgi:hypothetical protein